MAEQSNGGAKEPLKRRGRPRRNEKPKAIEDPLTPRRGRGRPKGPGSGKRAHSQEGAASGPAKKRGRPKGSPNKITTKKASDSQDVDAGTAKRDRGRPSKEVNGRSSMPKKRGRPKGSTNKVSRRKSKLGSKQRGRPRKHPLPSAEELKKPKVWKPLGRPRKYPRVDPPAGGTNKTLQRGRGRPLKADSKRGAHLKRNHTNV